MMYKYAVAHDIVDKDYASVMFANGNPIKRERTKEPVPFTDEEIQQLWDSKDLIPFADMVLIGIYSGCGRKNYLYCKLQISTLKPEP